MHLGSKGTPEIERHLNFSSDPNIVSCDDFTNINMRTLIKIKLSLMLQSDKNIKLVYRGVEKNGYGA